MLYMKYITPKNQMKLHPCKSVLNARYTTTEVESMPMTSHGLNLPHFVRVRSMILPIIGSLSASNTRAPTMMAVIAASCAALSLRVKSM